MNKIEFTSYGIRKRWKSRFVIVAPHAAGYDINTQHLAPKIAERLKAFLIVNTKYHKKRKKDFNKLLLNKDQQYIWGKTLKDRHMKEFYDDIVGYAQSIYKNYNKKPIIVFIHGMGEGKDKIDIDIGFGAADYNGQLLGTIRTKKRPRHPEAGPNTGVVRANRKDMKNLRNYLSNYGLKIGIGEVKRRRRKKRDFAAWDRKNGVQYFSKKFIKIPPIEIPPTNSFQLEIAARLRGVKKEKKEREEKVKTTSKIIAEALESVYGK